MNNLHPAQQTVSPILDEAAALAARWTESRADAAHTARDLLALWAHLLRFPSVVSSEPSAQMLDRLIQGDRNTIVQQLLNLPPPTQWLAAAQELETSWDSAGGPAALEALEAQARGLFEELDRNSLAVHAASRLLAADDPLRERLVRLEDELKKAESFLADHAEVFLPAAAVASARLRVYRNDLDETDEGLWLTTLKYRTVEELAEESQTGSLVPPLPANYIAALRAYFAPSSKNMKE
jgi:hypothetical protein